MNSKSGRIRERHLTIPVLQALAEQPTGEMMTSELIKKLSVRCNPTGADAEILTNRNDTRFSQIVRNIVSHKTARGNPIADGFIEYLGKSRGLRITSAGLDYLKRLAA